MRRVQGFSMIELLLALALGVVVVAGIVQLFVGNSQTYSLLTGQSRMQENGRFALDFVERSVRSAGFMGCAPERANIVRGLRGAGTPLDNWAILFDYDMTRFIEGVEGDGGFNPALGAVLPTTSATNVDSANVDTAKPNSGIDPATVEAGTDVLVVRQVDGGARLLQTLQPLGNPVVRAPGGDPGFAVNDVVMVSDCEQGAVFRVTGMNVAGNTATLLHATANAGDFFENGQQIMTPTGAGAYTLSYLGRSYGEEAVIGAVISTVFYVADSLGTNNRNDTPLSLWRRVGAAPAVELIQGVEDFDVLYGVDTTPNDGVSDVNRYVTFPNVADVDQVVAIRVAVTANSIDVVANQGDGILRSTFTQTILIRNANPAA